jgi:hypothetical protein
MSRRTMVICHGEVDKKKRLTRGDSEWGSAPAITPEKHHAAGS